MHVTRKHIGSWLALSLVAAGIVGLQDCVAQDFKAPSLEELKPKIEIEWRLGPDYPMGIQDSLVGCINGRIVSTGGFTRHPLDICEQIPDAFDGQTSGFTRLAFVFDPAHEATGWARIADMPGPARQGAAIAVVDSMLYAMGGLNYTEPFTYRDTYRLQEKEGHWVWEELPSCQLPWPVYGNAGSTAVIGKKIYLLGAADFFQGPGADGNDFHSESGRDGNPVGTALTVLDTSQLEGGWKRLADCPGVPKFNCAIAAAGGKIYQLGGVFAPLAKQEYAYYNAVDSWMYDPAIDSWTRLRDVPPGANRRALAYDDRYILLIAGYKYAQTWHLDQTVSDVYSAAEKTRDWKEFFENTVLVYDTKTGLLGQADPLIEPNSIPSSAIVGDTIYCLGGEGGPRLFHPATLQIGKIVKVIP